MVLSNLAKHCLNKILLLVLCFVASYFCEGMNFVNKSVNKITKTAKSVNRKKPSNKEEITSVSEDEIFFIVDYSNLLPDFISLDKQSKLEVNIQRLYEHLNKSSIGNDFNFQHIMAKTFVTCLINNDVWYIQHQPISVAPIRDNVLMQLIKWEQVELQRRQQEASLTTVSTIEKKIVLGPFLKTGCGLLLGGIGFTIGLCALFQQVKTPSNNFFAHAISKIMPLACYNYKSPVTYSSLFALLSASSVIIYKLLRPTITNWYTKHQTIYRTNNTVETQQWYRDILAKTNLQ